jgi:hypothetical protein
MLLGLAVLVCCARSAPALAAEITYDYTAVITAANFPGVSVGDAVRGIFTYETVLPFGVDFDPLPNRLFSYGNARYFSAHFGPYTAIGSAGRLQVWDDPGGDLFFMGFDAVIVFGPGLSFNNGGAGFGLFGPPTILASADIPPVLTFSEWTSSSLNMGWIQGAFSARLTSVSLPEPTTLLLVASGCGALLRRRFKRPSR